MAQINVGDNTTATAAFADDNGQPRTLYSTPQWTANPDGIVTLTPAQDGLTCAVHGVTAGSVAIRCQAEADPTPGQNTVAIVSSLDVFLPEDTHGSISFGG